MVNTWVMMSSWLLNFQNLLGSPHRIILHLPGFQLAGATSSIVQVSLAGSAVQYLDQFGPYAGECSSGTWRERVSFIGTEFSILYTSVNSTPPRSLTLSLSHSLSPFQNGCCRRSTWLCTWAKKCHLSLIIPWGSPLSTSLSCQSQVFSVHHPAQSTQYSRLSTAHSHFSYSVLRRRIHAYEQEDTWMCVCAHTSHTVHSVPSKAYSYLHPKPKPYTLNPTP